MKRTEAQNLMHALQGAAPTATAIQKVGWTAAFDFICDFVSVFSFSDFKAKAFSFCLFFYPGVIPNDHRVILSGVRSTTQRVILSGVRSTESKDLAIEF